MKLQGFVQLNQWRGPAVLLGFLAVALAAGACGPADMGTDVVRPRDVAADGRGDGGGQDVLATDDRPTLDVPSAPMDASDDVPAPQEAGPDVQCGVGETICTGICTAVATDRNNCGRCGNACPLGQLCSMGVCGVTCNAPEVVCGAGAAMRCVDVTTDRDNCGSCALACRADQQCSNGTCVCNMGQSNCNNPMGGASCVDIQTDRAHCGICGNVCPAGQECRAGNCVLPCPAPTSVCGVGAMMACVSLNTDANNCGRCGNRCSAGSSCQAGTCVVDCPAPAMVCNVAGVDRCLDVRSNNAHCGRCNNACAAAQSCVGGVCVCPAGTTLCGAQCVNLQADRSNCGGCGVACPGAQMCVSGRCQLTCPLPLTVCGAGAAMNCVNLQTDSANCGVCGAACMAPATCTAGMCRAPRPANDNFASATSIPLAMAEGVFMGSTVGATFDGPAGCSAGDVANVWYRFTLATTELVYADTAGSDYDTRLYLADVRGALVANTCNDDAGCSTGGFTSGLQSRFAIVLPAGTYYIAVSGFVAGSEGNYILHFQHLATNRVSNFIAAPISGTATASGTLAGASVATSNCGGSGSGEDARWFVTCGAGLTLGSMCMGDGGTFSRRIGAVNFDPSMYLISGITGGETVCNDDGGSMGGVNCVGTGVGADAAAYASRINFMTTGRGIHMLVADERIGGPGMTYTMRYQLQM